MTEADFDVGPIARNLNTRAGPYAIGRLQDIRMRLRGFSKRPSSDIFTSHTIHPYWAFHYGGRTELQFIIGLERISDVDELRHGVAFSFEPSQSENVADEHPSGLGTKIDVVLRRTPEEYWYYEIKTAHSPRPCIREALGQVMEYAHWPGAREPRRLIVCGENALDDDGRAYVRQLNERFRLPVAYEQIVLEE